MNILQPLITNAANLTGLVIAVVTLPGCAQDAASSAQPRSSVYSVEGGCPLEGTWTFNFERTEQSVKDANALFYTGSVWGEESRPRPDPFHVSALLYEYRNLIGTEWVFDCDTEIMRRLKSEDEGYELLKTANYTWTRNMDGSLIVNSTDGNGDPTDWSIEFDGDQCFEWTKKTVDHHVVWCRLE